MRARTELIAHEASQFIAADLLPARVSIISVCDRQNILNMLYYFGMRPFRDHWEYFRDLFGQQHLPVDLFRGYVTNVVHERDVCVSQRQHEQLVEQINFFSKVRRGAVTQDLDGIEEMEWPEGPNFWSPKCDAQLMLSLRRRGFSSTTLLIYESIEHWPFEI